MCVCVCLFEHALQHSSGVRGSGLPALNGVFKVLNASTAFPGVLKLALQNLSTTLPSQTGLLQTQLTHLHIILTYQHKNRRHTLGTDLENIAASSDGGPKPMQTSPRWYLAGTCIYSNYSSLVLRDRAIKGLIQTINTV